MTNIFSEIPRLFPGTLWFKRILTSAFYRTETKCVYGFFDTHRYKDTVLKKRTRKKNCR